MNYSIKKNEMFFSYQLYKAEFVDRPNRFIVRIKFRNKIINSHLPDPGRLNDLLYPGAIILVKKETGVHRKTKFSTQAVYNEGVLISTNTWLANDFIEFLINMKSINFLSDLEIKKREVNYKNNRFDFLLSNGLCNYYLEVKSVTLLRKGVALFPDCITKRGRKHMECLSVMANNGYNCMVIFLIQREDASLFELEWDIDYKFCNALLLAKKNGVIIRALKAKINKKSIKYLSEIPINFSHISKVK